MNNRLPVILLSVLMLASCGGGPTGTNEKNVASFIDSAATTPSLCDSFDIAQFAMDTERAALIADSFLAFYRHDDAAGRFTDDAASISISTQLMLAFESLAPELDPATQCLGVRIAYGLDEGARPLFLFGPVVMTRMPSTADSLSFRLDQPTAWYNPASGEWKLVDAAAANADMQRYASRVLKYVDGRLTALHIDPRLGSASDPSSTFFPFTEFRELIRENEAMLRSVYKDQSDIPSITAVRVCWAAERIGDDGTLKHVVVLVPVLGGPDYLGTQLPLTLKAANMNALCPPKCETVQYRAARKD